MTLRGTLSVQLIFATHDLLKLTLSETPTVRTGCLVEGADVLSVASATVTATGAPNHTL
jgi:hypothetical protein